MNNTGIEFVYFDVGGVAILDFSKTNKWEEFMRDLSIPEERFSDFRAECAKHVSKLHIGHMSIEEEVEILAREFELELAHDYDMLEDFVSRFERNEPLSALIERLVETHRVGLLTNMFPGMLDSIKAHNILPDVIWDAEVDSVEVQLQKPEPAIYKRAEEMAGVSGSQIFFVDNLEENLVAAEEHGWQTFLFDPADPLGSSEKLAKALQLE